MTNFPPIIISRLWNLPILDTRKLCQGRRRFIFWPFNCVLLLLANWRDRYLPIGTKNKFCHFVSWMVCMDFFWRTKIGQGKLFLTEFCMFYFFFTPFTILMYKVWMCVVFTYLKTILVKPSVFFAIQELSVHPKKYFPPG